MLYFCVGGDLYYKISSDLGRSWSAGTKFFTQEAFDGNPKYVVNQMAILSTGEWLLPFGTTAPGYPRTAGKAGVLVSTDAGKTWTEHGDLQIPKAPYVSAILEPAISPDGDLILMRSGNGFLYRSRKVPAHTDAPRIPTWTDPTKTTLPNPNSRPSLCGTATTLPSDPSRQPPRHLFLASNPDNVNISNWPAWGRRSLLTISAGTSTNATGMPAWTWQQMAVLEEDDGVSHCYPSVVHVGTHLVTAYSVYRQNVPRIGIKVARTPVT